MSAKAAETRSLLFVVRDICDVYNTGSPRDLHRLRCLNALCSIYNCCYENSYIVPLDQAENMLEDCDTFLLHYNWLCKNSMEHGFLCYHVVTKLHMFWHICFHARYINPRFVWAYEFEDLVGSMTTAAKSCMAGTPLRLVGAKVLENFLLVLKLRLTR